MNMAGFLAAPPNPYWFISLTDKYGIRFSLQKGDIAWFRDDGQFRTIGFHRHQGMSSSGGQYDEIAVQNTYEDIERQMGKP
jgi:hypothetical protein